MKPRRAQPMTRTRRHLALLAAAWIVPALAWPQGAPAPTAAASQAAASASAAASAPIPLSEVVAQADNASSTLKEIAADGSTDPATQEIERDLPALTEEINARLEETAQTVEGSTSLDKLKSFEADWKTLTTSLPQWRNHLVERARKLEGDLSRLAELGERWQQTLAQLRGTEAPPEIRARAVAILETAASSRRAIAAEQSRVLALQNRVAEQQTRADEAVKTIAARRDALVGRLLVQDAPPIWSPEVWTQTRARKSIRESVAAQVQGLSAFVARNRERLVFHAIVFAVFAAALLYLRRWARPLVEADPHLRQPATVFQLPISTALLLALLVNSRIYPQTPQILTAIFGAIALLPAVVILRKLFARTLYPLLYSLVVFFFTDQVRAVAEGAPSVARPLYLFEMLCGLVFFVWFYRMRLRRQPPPDDVRRGQVYRVVRVGSLVVLPFFALALVANAFGYVNLSTLVGGGVLRSLYAAVVLYVVVRIVDALVAFALRFRPLNLLHMARDHATQIRRKARKVILLVAVLLWITATLEFFTLRAFVFREARDLLTADLSVGSLSISAADVILFFLVVWLAFAVSRFVRFALHEDVFPRLPLARGVPYAISTTVNYAILLLGFFFAVSAAGLDLTRITVLVGAFGVGIGFGLQNIFNNFISGLILLFERPVEVGDEIRIGDASGIVRRIGIRASRIRQWDNSEVIVPNSKLISDNVKNWTLSAGKRGIEIPVSVAYPTDIDRVVALLVRTAKSNPLVADEPPPQVLLGDITPPTLNVRLRTWTAQTDKATRIASDLTLAVAKALAENDAKPA
jgi:potassium efflux system protein